MEAQNSLTERLEDQLNSIENFEVKKILPINPGNNVDWKFLYFYALLINTVKLYWL